MFHPLLPLKKILRPWITPAKQEPVLRKPRRVRPWLEFLEDRLAPATISDGGSAVLSIVLGTGENLAIVSMGTSYTFTSNQNFTAATGSDPANQGSAFAGLGTNSLTLTSAGMAQYGIGINITDTGANDTVTFNDSGTNAYGNNFNVSLGNRSAGTISFNGNTNFGSFNLQASTERNIVLKSGAFVISDAGNLNFLANPQVGESSGDFIGISVNNATIQCLGTGTLTIQGQGGGGTSTTDYGVYVANGGRISGGSGNLSVFGNANAANPGQHYGVFVDGGTITSMGGNVTVTGEISGPSFHSGGYGVYVGTGGRISSGGSGEVVVKGTVFQGTKIFGLTVYGVYLAGASEDSAQITSSGGNVQVTGTGGNGNWPGVFIDSGGELTAGGQGNVNVTGSGSAGGELL